MFVQGAGGNTSIKIRNKLYVKASGEKLKNMSLTHGYVCSLYKSPLKFFAGKKKYQSKDESGFLHQVDASIVKAESFGNPSMETGFHAVIPSRYVFHLHSVYANIFTCMKNGSTVLRKLFKKNQFLWIDYLNPGYELALILVQKKSLPPLIFLQNHGIIIHGESIAVCLTYLNMLQEVIEAYLKQKKAFLPFKLQTKFVKPRKYNFPDSAVFSNIDFKKLPVQKKKDVLEIFSAQQYIIKTIKKLKQQPVFLNQKNVQRLLNMGQEKYRQELVTK